MWGTRIGDGVLTMMQYRKLGRTDITVSEIGFGAWGIGGRTAGHTSYGATDDAMSRNALARALDLGITFYDTAPPYGDGHSEELIGAAFRNCRSRVVLATKVGVERFGEAADLSPQALRQSLEGSLRRLGCDYVDLLQIHSLEIAALAPQPGDSRNAQRPGRRRQDTRARHVGKISRQMRSPPSPSSASRSFRSIST